MDWLGLSEEHTLLRKEVAEFAKKEIEPSVSELDKTASSVESLVKGLAKLGLCGVMVPEEYGGAQMDLLNLVIALEEIARVSPSTSLSIAAHNIAALTVSKWGTEELRKELATEFAEGRRIAGMSVLPDVLSGESRENRNVIISGRVSFVVNGAFGDCYLVCINVGEDDYWGLVNGRSGDKFIPQKDVIGFRSCGTGILFFEKKLVAASYLLALESMNEVRFLKRMLLSAISVGICQGCLDCTIPYAKERHQFGQPIASFGMVQSMLSEIATRTSSSRLLLYDAAAKSQTDGKRRGEGESVAAYARESAMTVADLAVQIFGGYGYTKDYPVEMFFRDAKFLEAIPPAVSEAKCAAGELLVS